MVERETNLEAEVGFVFSNAANSSKGKKGAALTFTLETYYMNWVVLFCFGFYLTCGINRLERLVKK